MTYTVTQWIAHIDRVRESDPLLARGEWHGYLNDGSPVLHGEYVLARWRRTDAGGGSIVVAHPDPELVISFARGIEQWVSCAEAAVG